MKALPRVARFVSSIAILCGLLVISPAWSTPIMIDSFDEGSQSLAVPTGTVTGFASGLSSGNTIGGERDVRLTNTGSIASITIAPNPIGTFSFTSFNSVTDFEVQWDGSDSGSPVLNYNLGGIDFTDTDSGLFLDVTGFSGAGLPASLTFDFYTDANSWSTATVVIGSMGKIHVPLDLFSTGGANPVAWDNVNAIVMSGSVDTTGFNSAAFDLNFVQVPEPETLPLLGAGLLLMWGRLRRRDRLN